MSTLIALAGMGFLSWLTSDIDEHAEEKFGNKHREEQFWEELGRPQRELIQRYRESPLMTTMLQQLQMDAATLPEEFVLYHDRVEASTNGMRRVFSFLVNRVYSLEEAKFSYHFSEDKYRIYGNMVSEAQLEEYLKCRIKEEHGVLQYGELSSAEFKRMVRTARCPLMALAQAINERLGGEYEIEDEVKVWVYEPKSVRMRLTPRQFF